MWKRLLPYNGFGPRGLLLRRALRPLGVTKTSLLLGLGEQKAEVVAVMDTLREAAVDILVMGQYLRPSPKQIPVAAYISPEHFEAYAEEGRNRGFAAVVSSPLPRTSYHAYEAWKQALDRNCDGA